MCLGGTVFELNVRWEKRWMNRSERTVHVCVGCSEE